MKKVLLITIISITSAITIAGVSYMFLRPGGSTSLPTIDETDPKYQNQVLARPSSGSPADQSAVDNLFIAQGVFLDTEYKGTVSNGTCAASVLGVSYNQTIKNRKYINGDEAFSEALSLSSLKKVGDQRYVTQNDYLVRQGKNVSESGADWQGINAYSKQKFVDLYGQTPFGFTNYCLNEYSVASAEVLSEGDEYVYRYVLDPEIGPKKYARETATLGGASSDPVFSSSEITVTMDQNWVVSRVECTDAYRIDIMGGLNCVCTITNDYEYPSSAYDLPERAEFAPYFGKEANDNPIVVKDGEYYLNEGVSNLMTASDGLNVGGTLTIDDTELSLNAFVDLSDFDIRMNLNDALSVYYCDSNLYVNYGKIFAAVSKEELKEVVALLVPSLDLDGFSLDGLLESPAVANLMKDMTYTLTSDEAKLRFPTPIGSAELTLGISGDTAYFSDVSLDFLYQGHRIQGALSFRAEPYRFAEIPEDVGFLSNLAGNISSVQDFLSYGDYALTYSAEFSGVKLFGDAYVCLVEGQLAAETELHLVYREEEMVFDLKYAEDTLYLRYGDGFALALGKDEISDCLARVLDLLQIPYPSADSLIPADALTTVDFSTVLEEISSSMSGLAGKLNLSALGYEGILDLRFSAADGLCASLGDMVSVSVQKALHREVVPSADAEYLGYDTIGSYLDIIETFMRSGSADIALDFAFQAGSYTIGIQGALTFRIVSEGTALHQMLAAEGDFEIRIGSMKPIAVSLQYADDRINLYLDHKKVSFTYEEVQSLVQEAVSAFSLDCPQLDSIWEVLDAPLSLDLLDPSSLSVKELLDGIRFEDGLLSLRLGDTSLSVAVDEEGKMSLLFDGGNEIRLLAKEEPYFFDMDAFESDLSAEDARASLQVAGDIFSQLDARDFEVAMFGTYKELSYSASIRLHIAEGETLAECFTLSGDISVSYRGQRIELSLDFIGDTLYLCYEDVFGIRLGADELLPTVNDILNKLDYPEVALPDSAALEDTLNGLCLSDFILSLNAADQGVDLLLDLSQLLEEALLLKAEYRIGDPSSLTLSYGDLLNATFRTAEPAVYTVKAVPMLTAEDVRTYADSVFSLLERKTIEIRNMDVGLTLSDGTNLDIVGELILSWKNGLELEGQLSLKIQSVTMDIGLTYTGQYLYLELSGVKAKLSVADVSALVADVESKFGIDLQKVKSVLTRIDQVLNGNGSFDAETLNSLLDQIDLNAILRSVEIADDSLALSLDLPALDQICIRYGADGTILCTMAEGSELTIGSLESFEFTAPQYPSALDKAALQTLLDIAYDAYCYKDQDSFTFSFSGNAKDGSTYSGDISLVMMEDHRTIRQVQANILVNEKTETLEDTPQEYTRVHDVHFVYDGGREPGENLYYFDYNGNMKVMLDDVSLYRALGTLNATFLHNSLLETLFGTMAEGEALDIFDYYQSDGTETICLNDLLQSVTLANSEAHISLNLKGATYDISIKSHPDTHLLSGSLLSTEFNLIIPKSEFGAEIAVPSDPSAYMDLSSLDELMVATFHTVGLKKYAIESTPFTAKIPVLGTLSANVSVRAIIDQSNQPLVEIVMDIPYVFMGTNNRTLTTIYFDGEQIYAKRELKALVGNKWSTEYTGWTLEAFAEDPMTNLYWLCNFTSAVKSGINAAMKNSDEGGNHVIDYDQVLKSYSYDAEENAYTLSLNGVELCQDQNMKEIAVTLYPHTDSSRNTLQKADVSLNLCDGAILLDIAPELLDDPDLSELALPDWIANCA